MDYRAWLQQRKREDGSCDDTDDALGSKFEITKKTNSTILEESSKAEDDEESILERVKPHHRATNSKTINPMLLLTNTEQTIHIKSGNRDLSNENDFSSNTFYKGNENWIFGLIKFNL